MVVIRILACLLALGACTTATSRPRGNEPGFDWKRVATRSDLNRVTAWREAFTTALADARKAGFAAEIAREGVLLDPDAALPQADPAPGNYRCRTIKIGSDRPGLLNYVAYSPFACTIEDQGGVLAFTKTSGSQRPVGLIFPGDGPRRIFLGTLVLGDERRALDYGSDATRDMAGAIERIGDRRWRLILPYPRFESMMDVIELLPA